MSTFLPWSHGYWTEPGFLNLGLIFWLLGSVAGVLWCASHWVDPCYDETREWCARRLLIAVSVGTTGVVFWPLYLCLASLVALGLVFCDALPKGTFAGRTERRELKAAERRIRMAKRIAELEREAGIS